MARPRKLVSFAVRVMIALVLLFIATDPAAAQDCRTTVSAQAPDWADNFAGNKLESRWINGGDDTSDYGARDSSPITTLGITWQNM